MRTELEVDRVGGGNEMVSVFLSPREGGRLIEQMQESINLGELHPRSEATTQRVVNIMRLVRDGLATYRSAANLRAAVEVAATGAGGVTIYEDREIEDYGVTPRQLLDLLRAYGEGRGDRVLRTLATTESPVVPAYDGRAKRIGGEVLLRKPAMTPRRESAGSGIEIAMRGDVEGTARRAADLFERQVAEYTRAAREMVAQFTGGIFQALASGVFGRREEEWGEKAEREERESEFEHKTTEKAAMLTGGIVKLGVDQTVEQGRQRAVATRNVSAHKRRERGLPHGARLTAKAPVRFTPSTVHVAEVKAAGRNYETRNPRVAAVQHATYRNWDDGASTGAEASVHGGGEVGGSVVSATIGGGEFSADFEITFTQD